MKIKQPRKKPIKAILLIAGLLILVAGAYAAFAYTSDKWPFTKSDSGPTKEEQQTIDDQNAKEKQDLLDAEAANDDEATSDQTDSDTKSKDYNPASSGSRPKVSKSSDIDLAASTKNDQLVVSSKLPSISSGTCKITLTKGGSVVTKQADIIYSPEYSTCAGFSFTTSEISRGKWNIKLDVNSSAGSSSKSITYNF